MYAFDILQLASPAINKEEVLPTYVTTWVHPDSNVLLADNSISNVTLMDTREGDEEKDFVEIEKGAQPATKI